MPAWIVFLPTPASAGYDIAHIIERTCEPGGPLIVGEEWKREQDRDRLITEPGEVIGCRPLGADNRVQIAAGSQRISGGPYLCTYFSLLGRDGSDVCADPAGGSDSSVRPLMALGASPPGRLLLAGVVSADVQTVGLAPSSEAGRAPTITPIARLRAARLGAPRAFGYFTLTADRTTLCADRPPRVIGRDDSGRRVAGAAVPRSTRYLAEADGVPYSHSLDALCGPRPTSQPRAPDWLAAIGKAIQTFRQALP